MKNCIFPAILISSVLFFSGCGDGKKNSSGQAETPKTKDNNYREYVVNDAAVKVDKDKLIKLIRQNFPVDSILKEFGPGTHNFYIAMTHRTGNDKNTFYFLKYLQLYKGSWTYDPSAGGYNFFRKFTDNNEIFRVDAAYNRSAIYKYFDVKIGVDRKKNIIYPWTVTELDAGKFYPNFIKKYDSRFKKNYEQYDFLSGNFSTIIGGYEAVSRKIVYPEEARKNGVTGRVVVIAFVESSGEVVGTQLRNGIGFGCDEAALKAVSEVKFYPTNSKFTAYVPVDFELEYKPDDYDLTSTELKFKPEHVKAKENCTIEFNVINQGSKNVPACQYKTVMYIDNKMVFADLVTPSLKQKKERRYWLTWVAPQKPGTYEYVIYIDQDKALNESNRENNIIKGKVTVY